MIVKHHHISYIIFNIVLEVLGYIEYIHTKMDC